MNRNIWRGFRHCISVSLRECIILKLLFIVSLNVYFSAITATWDIRKSWITALEPFLKLKRSGFFVLLYIFELILCIILLTILFTFSILLFIHEMYLKLCQTSVMELFAKIINGCSKLTIKTPERRQWRRSSILIVTFEQPLTIFAKSSLVRRLGRIHVPCSSLLSVFSFRSSPSHMFYKIGVLKNFVKFTVKHLCWNLFFSKAWGLQLYQKRGSNTDVFYWILRNFKEHLFL